MAWSERYCSPTGAGAHDGLTAGDAWTLAEAISGVNAGHRVNMIAGTYNSGTPTTNRTFGTGAGAGTTTAPKWWRGYNSAIGDLDTLPTTARTPGTDCPLISFSTGLPRVSDSFNVFSNMEFRGTAPGTHFFGCTGSKCKFIRCRFDCQEAHATRYTVRVDSDVAGGDGTVFEECYFKGTSTVNYVVLSNERIAYLGCQFIGGGNGCQANLSGEQVFIDCIFDDNGDDGLEIAGVSGQSVFIEGCTFYSPGGNGINITSAIPASVVIRNCLFHTITAGSTFALKIHTGSATPFLAGNAYYNVTVKFSNLTEDMEHYAVALGSDPCVNVASHDFTPASGSAILAVGVPGLFEGP